MRVIKKVNNNVAICCDGSGRQCVAFGKGIGFGVTSHESVDLARVERTFYDVSPQYLAMIESLPSDVIEFTAGVVDVARAVLPYELSPNLLLTLSDHIAFAIRRAREGIYLKMPLALDIEHMYPQEIELARRIVASISSQFKVLLPKDEASGVAMALINAHVYVANDPEAKIEEKRQATLDNITAIIEQEMGVRIDRDTFNYARYATHVCYLLDRLQMGNSIDSVNLEIYMELRAEYADVAICIDKIAEWLERERGFTVADEERLYLLLHVNRVCSNEKT